MCIDPITATLISTGVSAGVAAVGSMATGMMRSSEAKANAAALEASAQQREETAKFQIERADVAYRREAGAVGAKIGTTGVDVTSFSSVLADDAKESALQKSAIQVGADVERNNLLFQASGQKMQAKSDIVSGIFGAATAAAKGYGRLAQIDAIGAKGAKLDDWTTTVDEG